MTTNPDSEFRIRLAAWPGDEAALRLLRERIFVQEQRVPVALEWDGLDAEATHLLAEDLSGRPIGTARLLPSGQIGRMAVIPEHRGQGIGARLLEKTLEIATNKDYPRPWLNAQTSAEGFYLKAGFEPEGDKFMEAGIPHQKMRWGDKST